MYPTYLESLIRLLVHDTDGQINGIYLHIAHKLISNSGVHVCSEIPAHAFNFRGEITRILLIVWHIIIIIKVHIVQWNL